MAEVLNRNLRLERAGRGLNITNRRPIDNADAVVADQRFDSSNGDVDLSRDVIGLLDRVADGALHRIVGAVGREVDRGAARRDASEETHEFFGVLRPR